MFSFIQNGFNASQLMNQIGRFYVYEGENVTVPGNYYYNNYSYLLGVTRSWEMHRAVFGISLMLGMMEMNTPDMQGSGEYYDYTSSTATSCYLNVTPQVQHNFDFDLGLHADFKITGHIFLRGLLDFQLSQASFSGGYQTIDASNGTSINAGSYPAFNAGSNSVLALFFNATAGLGFKF
jgi:hypothetical protein